MERIYHIYTKKKKSTYSPNRRFTEVIMFFLSQVRGKLVAFVLRCHVPLTRAWANGFGHVGVGKWHEPVAGALRPRIDCWAKSKSA